MKTIQVSDECWRGLKMQATLQERTIGAVVEEATAAYLRRPIGSVAEKTSGAAVRMGAGASSNEASMGVRTVPVPGDEDRLQGSPHGMVGGVIPRGSVAEKNETAARVPRGTDRTPETVCGRCGQAWKNHQDGSRKNRAPVTGCASFQDPSPKEPVF